MRKKLIKHSMNYHKKSVYSTFTLLHTIEVNLVESCTSKQCFASIIRVVKFSSIQNFQLENKSEIFESARQASLDFTRILTSPLYFGIYSTSREH